MWHIIKRTPDLRAVDKGMLRLFKAMDSKKISWKRLFCEDIHSEKRLFIGLRTDNSVERLTGGLCPAVSESMLITKLGGNVIVAGSDERGLAYALYTLAERIEAYGEDALLNPKEEIASPDTATRAVDRFISNTGDEKWWMNADFWEFYLDMLLAARYNRLTLTAGFDTAYLSPPYPFFVEVPGFEQVRVNPDFSFDRDEYLAALRSIGAMCHEYGLEFSFAIWQQQPWQTGQFNLIEGMDNVDMLMDFCAAGVKELIKQCPEIDVIQYRVNHESGVGTQVSAEDYWLRQIEAVAEANNEGFPVRLDLRAKGMTDKMVWHAKARGLDVFISTKYSCEQAGLPHHLHQMRAQELARLDNFNASRRYGYADMLKKPRTHHLIYRIWCNGSINLFTWGDPDYVRRFVDSMRLGPADGYEVMVPLSYKGGQEFHKDLGWKLFDDIQYQPVGWEDDRYWLFYRLFGRLGYNKNADSDEWMLEMNRRFGTASVRMMDVISSSSRLLPFLVGWHFPEHPQESNWPELSSGAALFRKNSKNIHFRNVSYQSSLPSDEGLFYSIDNYMRDEAFNSEDGRYTPIQVLTWMEDIVSSIEASLEAVEKIGIPDNPEAKGAVLDARMLRLLALYHIHKTQAAMMTSRHQQLGDTPALLQAAAEMKKAIEWWTEMSDLGKAYHSNLLFGVGVDTPREGTWSDYLPEMQADLARLEELIAKETPKPRDYVFRRSPYANIPAWRADIPAKAEAGKSFEVTLRDGANIPIRGKARVRLRHTNNLEGAFRTIPMTRIAGGWKATIPATEMSPDWDLLLYFEATAANGDGLRYPGLWNPDELQPYFIITVE